jgi:glucan phosphoethanolaminetransferase (alkaline phosphatase superfamily)
METMISILLFLTGILVVLLFIAMFFIVQYTSNLKMFKKKIKQIEKEIISTHYDINMVEKTLLNQLKETKEQKTLLKG